MNKASVTRLFIGSIIAVAAGGVLAIAAVWLAIANDVFVMAGPDIIGIQGGALAWSLIVLGVVGGVAIAVGMIGNLVAWIGAVLNTWQLESKAWFIGLLLLGIFNLGLFAMIAYLVAGPDGRSPTTHRTSPATAAA
jgi:hypothetical protein